VFSENCRVIRKKETIMLQIADLMGSIIPDGILVLTWSSFPCRTTTPARTKARTAS